MYYINIRDIKCKRISLQEIIRDEKPTVIAITEAWIDEDYEMEIDGYVIHKNCKTLEAGGIILAVVNELKYVTSEVARTKEYVESLWIVINNKKVKLRIGAVYFPQENEQNLTEIYKVLKQQIKEAGENEELVFIVGDFNCKVGGEIKGNTNKASKGGKKLLKFLEKEGMALVNSKEICKGTWTRAEGKSRSILDYVVVDKELGDYIKEMVVHDTSKDLSPFHLKKKRKEIRMVYSDHNPIIVKTDLIMMQKETMEKRRKAVLTKEGMKKYHDELQRKKVSQIWNGVENLEEAYVEWERTVMETRKKYEQVRKPTDKRKSKTMRLLMIEKKKIKNTEIGEERTGRLKQLKRKMMEEEQASYYRKLQRTCEEIRVDGKFSSGGFWKMRKRMRRKKDDEIHAVEDKEGKLLTENEDIIKRYGEYFKDLLTNTNNKTRLPENKDVVENVERKFKKIWEEGMKQQPKETEMELVKRTVNKLKRGKARDDMDWNNEMVKGGGEEMLLSLKKMADIVKQKLQIPSPWQSMIIKSTHKQGTKADLNNKRGLFLTNIISKIFETIQDQETEVLYDILQNGGTRGRGIVDSWIILMALRDEARRLQKPLYLFFGDLVKCFDRLWLKDCVVDLHECGMRERDAIMVYKLNEEAKFKVSTPAGMTEMITVKEIVKQGTVFGPKLCCATTGKVNEGLEEREYIYPSVSIQAVTFVDDINGGGSKKFTEAVMVNCSKKEDEKLWEFSKKKSNWMCMKNRKRDAENIEVEVKQGKLEQTQSYKLLGNYINEQGNLDDQLQYMETKAIGVVREGNKLCCQNKVGKAEFDSKKLVYEMQMVPAVFFNLEVWTNLRKSDITKLESIQGKIMRGTFGLPKSTPYWGLLFELNILPIMLVLTYKKIMLYHNIVNSDERRVAKQIVREQEKSGFRDCWFGNVEEEGGKIGIKICEELVKGKQKSKWKKRSKKED